MRYTFPHELGSFSTAVALAASTRRIMSTDAVHGFCRVHLLEAFDDRVSCLNEPHLNPGEHMSFWKKLFGGKEEEPSIDPFADLVLPKLAPGFLVDYDGRTFEVVARHHHDTGDGYRTDDWELRCEGAMHYLNRIEADGVLWTLTRKIPLGMIDERLKSQIQQHGDPLESIDFEGTTFFMQSYGGAQFYRDGRGPAQPFLYWDYEDELRERVLTIEQWGDIQFEAYVGQYVEEYQFIHILPGKQR